MLGNSRVDVVGGPAGSSEQDGEQAAPPAAPIVAPTPRELLQWPPALACAPPRVYKTGHADFVKHYATLVPEVPPEAVLTSKVVDITGQQVRVSSAAVQRSLLNVMRCGYRHDPSVPPPQRCSMQSKDDCTEFTRDVWRAQVCSFAVFVCNDLFCSFVFADPLLEITPPCDVQAKPDGAGEMVWVRSTRKFAGACSSRRHEESDIDFGFFCRIRGSRQPTLLSTQETDFSTSIELQHL